MTLLFGFICAGIGLCLGLLIGFSVSRVLLRECDDALARARALCFRVEAMLEGAE